MVKLAVLKSVFFDKKANFKDIEKVEKNLDGKVVFNDYKNTKEMLLFIHKIFGKDSIPDVDNCYYDNNKIS